MNLKVTWLFNWGDKTVYVNGKKTIKEHYWSHITAKVILGLYGFCLLLIFYELKDLESLSLIKKALSLTFPIILSIVSVLPPTPKPSFS